MVSVTWPVVTLLKSQASQGLVILGEGGRHGWEGKVPQTLLSPSRSSTSTKFLSILAALTSSLFLPRRPNILMPASPIQVPSRRGLQRLSNALAMTAARRPAMVCLTCLTLRPNQRTTQ